MSEFITEWMPDAHLYKEPIVRCRDCKHRAGANVQAVVSDLCMWLDIIVKPDGFCAWGTPKNYETTPKVVSE